MYCQKCRGPEPIAAVHEPQTVNSAGGLKDRRNTAAQLNLQAAIIWTGGRP
jgi:NAD(P)H-dependent flavin oxidoreductase YrpB (nitropropane dioxygenase family)